MKTRSASLPMCATRLLLLLAAAPLLAEQPKPVDFPKSPITTASAGFEQTKAVDLDGSKFDVVAVTNLLDPDWLKPAKTLYQLGPGDRLEIESLGDAASRASVVVGPDGKIYYSLLPGLNVWGRTLEGTRQALMDAMKKYLRTEPDIAVTLRAATSKTVWVLGNVQVPGVQPLAAPTTLLDIITLSGGPLTVPGAADGFCDLKRSFLMRAGKLAPIDFEKLLREGDLSQNIYVQANDLVYLRSAARQNVYVLGAVTAPNIVYFADRMTLLEAIAACGGPLEYAYQTHVAVIRGSLVNPQAAIVNFREIRTGKAKDLKLEPGDIVYIPYVPWRKLALLVEILVRDFVYTMAANEGYRAAVRNAAPLAPSIPFFTPGGTTISVPGSTTGLAPGGATTTP